MFKNQKAEEQTFSLLVGATIFLIVVGILIYMFSSGVTKPWSKATSCPEEGQWMSTSCDITVSTEQTLAADKDYENDHCCIPTQGKEEDFKKWVASSGAAVGSSSSGEVTATDTVSFQIGDDVATPGSIVEVEKNSVVDISAVKNMDEGDFCSISIIKAHSSSGSIVPLQEGVYFVKPKTYDSCSKLTEMELSNLQISQITDNDGEGLYLVEVKVYDKILNKEISNYVVYVKPIDKPS